MACYCLQVKSYVPSLVRCFYYPGYGLRDSSCRLKENGLPRVVQQVIKDVPSVQGQDAVITAKMLMKLLENSGIGANPKNMFW